MSCSADAMAGAWSEIAYVTIWKCGESNGTEFAALTETVDIDMGTKDIEYTPTMYGGRVGKRMPQGDITITFEGYPLTVGGEVTGNATGIDALFQGGTTWPTSDYKVLYSTHHRDLFRISVMWTDDPSTSLTGAGSTAINYNAYRLSFAGAMCTEAKPSFTDGMLKTTFVFKVAPFNKWRVANHRDESVEANGVDGMDALSDYTAANYPQDGTAYTWV